MKDWKGLKFVNEMYSALCAFFGADAENTTEAELHQKLVEAGSLENIKAASLKEANEAVSAQMSEFQSQLEALQSNFAELKADAEAKGEKVAELQTALEAVNEQIEAKDKEIAELKGQNTSLSGQVASLKAGKPFDGEAPPDASLEMPKKTAANGGTVVSGDALQKAFSSLGNKKMN